MTIIVLNKNTEGNILRHCFCLIKSFLYDLTCDYPFFEEWLNMSLSEILTDKRQIVILTETGKHDRVVGLTVLKTEPNEKKICTIRVDKEFQRQGFGTLLIKESLRILGTDKPLITVSEKHIDVFKPFLKQFGFKVAGKVRSLYHTREYEYFFNVPYVHANVLISIKPQYVEKILCGKKTVEFRRKCFSSDVKRAYIYSSSPEKRIIGYFEVIGIDTGTPNVIWQEYGREGAITKEAYDCYTYNCHSISAVRVGKTCQFSQKIAINDVSSMRITVPQNFCFVDNVMLVKELENIK